MRAKISMVSIGCIVATVLAPAPVQAGDRYGTAAGIAAGVIGGMIMMNALSQAQRMRQPVRSRDSVRRQRGTGAGVASRGERSRHGRDVAPEPTELVDEAVPAAKAAAPGKVFSALPARPVGPSGRAFADLPPRPMSRAPSAVAAPAPWLSGSDAPMQVQGPLEPAISAFLARAGDLGLRHERFTRDNLRREASVALDGTQRLTVLASLAEIGWDAELLQAIILVHATGLLGDREFADPIGAGDARSEAAIELLFAKASHSASITAEDLHEANGLTNSIERLMAGLNRLFPASTADARDQAPRLVASAISDSAAGVDAVFDRQGLGLKAKARVRRMLFDCVSERLPAAVQSLAGAGGAMVRGAVENALAREASLGCAPAIVAQFGNGPQRIDVVPANVVWTSSGFQLDGRPWVAASTKGGI